DAFVTKVTPDGSGLDYSTYLGGSGTDDGEGIAVDGNGNAYVTGITFSGDFPTTATATQSTSGGGSDGFVAKLSKGIDIVADTNRDSKVTDADENGKDTFTKDRGAIFSVEYVDADNDGVPDGISFKDDGTPVETHDLAGHPSIVNTQDVAPVVIRKLGKLPAGSKVYLKWPEKEDIQSIYVFKNIAVNEEAIWGGLGDRVAGGAAQPLEEDITPYVSETEDRTFGIEGLFFPTA